MFRTSICQLLHQTWDTEAHTEFFLTTFPSRMKQLLMIYSAHPMGSALSRVLGAWFTKNCSFLCSLLICTNGVHALGTCYSLHNSIQQTTLPFISSSWILSCIDEVLLESLLSWLPPTFPLVWATLSLQQGTIPGGAWERHPCDN